MKIATPTHDVELKGTIKSREFAVKAGAHIMSVLSNLYTDPSDAMVREYLTNMVDAYTSLRLKRGVKEKDFLPPVLSLPTPLNPILVFKDFGIGMSEQTVWDVYTQYGNSTKNDSNEEIGGFGLGSKVAFCYNGGSAWSIESRFDGKLHTFMAFIGKDGIPTMTHVSSVDTTEHNGVTVTIPIARKDIPNVVKAGEKYARYFPLPLVIEGASDKYDRVPGYLMKGKSWALHPVKMETRYGSSFVSEDNVLNVVMGNVPYPVSRQDVYPAPAGYNNQQYGRMPHREIWDVLSRFSFDLFIEVGSVDIVPSRDTLQFTEKTRDAVADAFKVMMKDLPKEIESQLAAAPTEYEAFLMVMKLQDTLGNVFNNKINLTTLKWQGKTFNVNKGLVRSATDLKTFDPKATMVVYSNLEDKVLTDAAAVWSNTGYRDGNIDIRTSSAFVGNKNQYVVINDMLKGGDKIAKAFLYGKVINKTHSGRKATYGHKAGMVTVLTTKKSAQQIADFFGGMPVANIQLLSTLSTSVVIPRALNAAVDAVYKWTGGSWASRVNRPSATVNYYLPLTKSADSGRWMYVDRNWVHSMREPVDRIVSALRSAKAHVPAEIFGVKDEDVSSLDASWVNLETLVWDMAVANVTANMDSLVLACAYNVMPEVANYTVPLAKKFGSAMKGDPQAVIALHGKIVENYKVYSEPTALLDWMDKTATVRNNVAHQKIVRDFRIDIAKKAELLPDFGKMCHDLMAPYPMLRVMFGARSHYRGYELDDAGSNPIILDYIKSMK